MIFHLKNNIPTIDIVGVNMPEFRAVWLADKRRNKAKAKAEMAYIYHMVSASSPYFSLPEKEKESTIIDEYFPEDIKKTWKASDKVKAAVKRFANMPPNNSPSVRMLQAANGIADKLADYFNKVDFEEINEETGQLLHDPKRVVDTLKSLSHIINEIKELEDSVKRDQNKDDMHVVGGDRFSMIEDEF